MIFSKRFENDKLTALFVLVVKRYAIKSYFFACYFSSYLAR